MTQPAESEYDAIAGAYKDSKQLSFRKYIEEYTLFETLGDIGGVKALDLACGEGFYTRKLKLAGFHWVDPRLHPSERDNGFWDEFMAAPPVIGFAAVSVPTTQVTDLS
ncbi:MAG: hypothetical protein OXD39_12205 [Gemmatimonadetes bacterium]|nr:hypothetical protein [Gemmatimonadota bacterium]